MKNNTVEQQTTPPSFVDNLAKDVTLSGGAMNGFIRGDDVVRSFLGTVKGLYKDFTIVYQGDTDRYQLQEYTANLEGHPVTGVVTLRKNADGKYDQVVVNHRPLSSLLLFSSLVSKTLEGKVNKDHFFRPKEQTLPDLLEYAATNRYK
jgi:hypothetical protein